MNFVIKQGNLFDEKNVDLLVQCIAEDFGLGAGIAVEFRKLYPFMAEELSEVGYTYPDVAIWDKHPFRPDVANVISKPISKKPPKFEDFEKAIARLREVVIERGYKNIAMPAIGSGLDKLDWDNQIVPTLHKYFDDLDVNVTVCLFTPPYKQKYVPKKGK